MSSFTDLQIQVNSSDHIGSNLLIPRPVQATPEAQQGLTHLLEALARVGLAIEVRNGDNQSLLVFVKAASDERLSHEVYRTRLVVKAPKAMGYYW